MGTNQVYAVAGAKGGVGKTTTSINLGATLVAMDYDVVVVELDLAMANLVDFLEVDIGGQLTFHDVLAGDAEIDDVIAELDGGLAIAPSGTDLAGYSETDLDRLPSVVETLRWAYDVVILDTPAGVSEEVIRPMLVADEVILVSTPRVSSVRNTDNTIELAERVDTDVEGLVLTKSGTGKSPGAPRIAEFLDVELLGHVPEDDAVPHSQDQGLPVVDNEPRSGAAVAYRKIARSLVGADPTTVPEPTSAWSKSSSPQRETASRTNGGSDHTRPLEPIDPATDDDEAASVETRPAKDRVDDEPTDRDVPANPATTTTPDDSGQSESGSADKANQDRSETTAEQADSTDDEQSADESITARIRSALGL